ncbi:transglycosylase domain-containing protein [Cellulophaga sp. 20_2_10]|uniref:transglycosylase domain-containing protein n=1 Tax=Cellulophaga sp. 20_2_10 TaxID=2942476 RepID=UPI00201AE6E7|nr:transglycosylase domain-containing protein [Cellulophaga sp. 20_2_10]MCL5247018.1 transglycosylase domain-containing protein [Cellulophaga sp. 20_2_10]
MILKKIKNPYLRYSVIALLGLICIGILFITSVYTGLWGKLPSKEELTSLKYQQASEVYSADSVLIGKYYLLDRQPIAYAEFPKHLTEALVAIEDERFYDHSGIDYKSMLRVAFKSILLRDKSSGGGSTISQQLAKKLYPRTKSGTLNLAVSKIKEMFIARKLESIYNKEEILSYYLNQVSFGDNTFGIESASLKFFNKHTKNLSIPEAATLVGMLKATYGYNPRVFPEKSKGRRNLVMQAMHTNNYIDQKLKDSLIKTPLELDYRDFNYNDGVAPYFREEVRKQLLKWVKDKNDAGSDLNIYTSGLKIYTTLDYKMQVLAEEAMQEHMKGLQSSFEKSYGKNAPWLTNKSIINKAIKQSLPYKKLKELGLAEAQILDSLNKKKTMTLSNWDKDSTLQASTIDSIKHYSKFLNIGSLALDPENGEVKVWIGGIDFKQYKYDHISQSKRQVGSTFKPIVYTTALEQGIGPCTYFSAEEVEYKNLKQWSPSNTGSKDETFLNYSMKEALSNSVNTVAVKVLEKAGIPNTIAQAKKMGITAELPNLPSLALGTAEVKISELATAYTSYVNNGKHSTPILIKHITNSKDSIMESFKPTTSKEPAFSPETNMIMIELMKATINTGTAARIRNSYKLTNDIAGKTGTTQNNKDAWFVGVTPKLVSVTWVGLDNHEIGFKSTGLGQGANAALPAFALLLQKMNKNSDFDYITKAKFKKPTDAVLQSLDCQPSKKDGFLKRLFKNPNKKKSKDFKSN